MLKFILNKNDFKSMRKKEAVLEDLQRYDWPAQLYPRNGTVKKGQKKIYFDIDPPGSSL